MYDHTSAKDPTQDVRHAIGRLAPRWTTWTLQTIQQHGQMRFTEFASALPWIGTQNTQWVLRRMLTDGLLDRPQLGLYEVTPLGRHAHNAHRALASWHRAHFTDCVPVLAEAERTEDALCRLCGKGAVDVLHALSQHGPLPNGDLREEAGLATGSFHYRVQQLQEDQLLTRTGPSNRVRPDASRSGTRARVRGDGRLRVDGLIRHCATQPHNSADHRHGEGQRGCTADPSAFPGWFSHAPEPQPRVPAHVTALSLPSQTR